ncbi:MAG: DEAD/DEAH box helicase [Candidatus Diapherotrites archaeon]
MKFEELNINKRILNALYNKGFEKVSKVQEMVIPEALLGKDVVGKSQTGTGKTAAFAIPLIEKIKQGERFSALIVVPTRELATQVKEEIREIAIGSHIRAVAVFGGQSLNIQARFLDNGPEIIVGTPGRLLDLSARRMVDFRKTRFLVLDEADKMFDMGFRDDVARIISLLPKERQTLLFSATMPSDVRHLVDRHLKKDKVFFDLSKNNAPVQEVEQFCVMVDQRNKINSLMKVLSNGNQKALVFCRTKRTVDWLERQLSKKGVKTLAIHGDKSQNIRTKIIDKFKSSRGGMLIATDVVSRGIHVDDIELVVNFDFPAETETYLHRIGRTARQGRKGKAVSLCTNALEKQMLDSVGRSNNTQIQELYRNTDPNRMYV